jgi:hypothetical protein
VKHYDSWLAGAVGIELKATLKACKFRAPDMVGRKGVRFLLQESTGFSIPTDWKSGQV